MYFIYVIQSLSHDNRYVGSSNNISKRLKEHNLGKCRYTKGRRPWNLVYNESFPSRSEAIIREKFLKSGKGREFLDKIINNE